MQLKDLVGRIAVRANESSLRGRLFLFEPVLVLSCTNNVVTICPVQDTEYFAAGTTMVIPDEYLDDWWMDYGDMLNIACNTKTQVLKRLLDMIGIEADQDSLYALCQCVTYKQFLSQLSEDLGITELLHIMGADKPKAVSEPVADVGGWKNLQSGGTFVRRGV